MQESVISSKQQENPITQEDNNKELLKTNFVAKGADGFASNQNQ